MTHGRRALRVRRAVHPGRQQARMAVDPVPGRELHELRCHRRRRIQRAELALGPPLEPAVLDVEHPRIARRGGGFARQRQALAARIEAHVAQVPLGQSRRGEFELRHGVEHGEAAAAILVGDVGEVAPVGADVEVLHVPEHLGGDAAVLVADRVLQLHLRELAVLVGEHVDAAAVGGELGAPDAAGQGLGLQRRQRPGRGIRKIEVAFVRRQVPPHQELRVIRRPVERVPGVGLAADQQLRRRRRGDVHHVNVVAEGVAVVAVERDALAVVRPHRAAVDEVPAGQLARGAARGLVEDLVIVITGPVLPEHEAAAALGGAAPLDGVRVEGELLARSAWACDAMQLLGFPEARLHQEAAVGHPVDEGGAARVQVPVKARAQRRVRRRHALEGERAAFAGGGGLLCKNRAAEEQRGGTEVQRARRALKVSLHHGPQP